MRGIVLAGGTGSRLAHATRVINKHCLPVYDRPMISWPIKVLKDNGIFDITIVTTPTGVDQLKAVLYRDDDEYQFVVQETPGGVAQALACADRGDTQDVAVILGDNVFLPKSPYLPKRLPKESAYCFLYRCNGFRQLRELGVATLNKANEICTITEKPEEPASKYASVGLYAFSSEVFYLTRTLNPSARGEVEITSVLNWYAAKGWLAHGEVHGFWGDAGTPDGLLECAIEAQAVRSYIWGS